MLTSSEAIGLLVMMYPILCKVQFETLHLALKSRELWIQVGFSILLNWIIAPFLMVCGMNADLCGHHTDKSLSLASRGPFSPTKKGSVKDLFLSAWRDA